MEVFVNLVGVTFRPAEAKEIVKRLNPDDGYQLSLEAEPNNPYDSNAVKVIHNPTGMHIGYLAKENNYDVARALENGEELSIEIVGFENTIKPTLLIRDNPLSYADTVE
jgi:hypothetical protein